MLLCYIWNFNFPPFLFFLIKLEYFYKTKGRGWEVQGKLQAQYDMNSKYVIIVILHDEKVTALWNAGDWCLTGIERMPHVFTEWWNMTESHNSINLPMEGDGYSSPCLPTWKSHAAVNMRILCCPEQGLWGNSPQREVFQGTQPLPFGNIVSYCL